MSEVITTTAGGTTTAPAAPAAPSAPAAPETPAASGQPPVQNEAGKAPAAEPEGEKPDTGSDPEKRGQRRFDRKIDRLHRRAAEAEARASLFEKQYNEARSQQAPAADPKAPRLEQFDDIEKYAQAKAKYESEKVLNEHRSKQQEETQKQHAQRLSSDWEEKASRAEDKYDDFAEVVGEISPTSPFAIAIMRAENGDDIAYHLGKNIKEAQRIAGLDPYSQILAVGQLSAKLASQPAKPQQPSKAPPPINPVGGAAAATGEPDPKKDFGAWMKVRQKQEGKVRV